MATRLEVLQRPAATADYARPSRYRTLGFVLGVAGLMLAAVTLIANIVAADDLGGGTTTRETLAWSFGLTTVAFGTLKFGIAAILMGVLVRAWMRVDAREDRSAATEGERLGRAIRHRRHRFAVRAGYRHDQRAARLLIHRIAPKAWAPMLAMGVMLVAVGLVLAIVQAGTENTSEFSDLGAWVQGVQFLGEGMLLAGISFLLGSILSALRNGGGEVQESVGVTVKTLKMPASAKAFVAIMMLGVMVAMAQFVLYIVATTVDEPAAWFAWLGPLRELGLGLLLGIVLALYTIGTVLAFQFNRMREIVTTGN